MRWLKALVIGMGIAILVGLTVVVVEVVQRAGEPSQTAATGPAPPVIGAPASGLPAAQVSAFSDRNIAIPAGAQVKEVVTDSARITVHLQMPDGSQALLLIDPASGRKLGLVTFDNRGKEP